jgi:hypothetical protein
MAETKVTPAEISNPYKFSAYRNATLNLSATTFTTVVYDAKNFDTSNNYSVSTGLFTAPVAGFYSFTGTITLSGPVNRLFLTFVKNSSGEYSRGSDLQSSVAGIQNSVFLQLAAGDTVQMQAYVGTAVGVTTGTQTQFSGYLVSTT